jgi:hypothetical protein
LTEIEEAEYRPEQEVQRVIPHIIFE